MKIKGFLLAKNCAESGYLSNSFLSFGIDWCFLTQLWDGLIKSAYYVYGFIFGKDMFFRPYTIFVKLGFGYCSFKLMN